MNARPVYLLALLVTAASLSLACSDSSTPGTDGGTDALPVVDVPAGTDVPVAPDVPGSVDMPMTPDLPPPDLPPADMTGDGGGSGMPCGFNRDCPASERCECDEKTGCFCRTGPRGTGQNGVDTCVDGNDCESSLCVEGQQGMFYCSDECNTPADCGPNLPECTVIAGIGRICIRASK